MNIEIDNVELNFGKKKILHGVYLKAETGQVTGVLGRNGSGKTCLLRILFGDLKPKYKSIRIDEKHVKYELFKTGKVAYLPQNQLLSGTISLKKAFRLFCLDWNDFVAIFNSFKIYGNTKITEISSGELRVIETYLILNSGKEIILLDEPFSFIAPLYIEKFKEIIQEKKNESAILITDHCYNEILTVSDKIYLIKNGSSKLIKSIQQLENEGYTSASSQQK